MPILFYAALAGAFGAALIAAGLYFLPAACRRRGARKVYEKRVALALRQLIENELE